MKRKSWPRSSSRPASGFRSRLHAGLHRSRRRSAFPTQLQTRWGGRTVMDGGHTESWRLDGVRIVALHGEHDLSNVASLQVELDAAIAASSGIIIDLTDAEFVDSTTLQALLQSHRAAHDRDLRFA